MTDRRPAPTPRRGWSIGGRRDVVAGLLVLAAVGVWAVGAVPGTAWPLAGTRSTALVVLVLGLAAAWVGGAGRASMPPSVMRPLAALGLIAAATATVTLVTGSPLGLSVLVLLVVVLWLLATVHHLSARR
ncbi:hypothetical protein PHK61_14485 [Actinomycetospora lutea]|uniref:hypothetical protein n=1 Tax=Actinomycetospora lutea TaxID=663604 RepID=UPI002366F2BB|nr:hypothetical protein [Actinomycetospora lutea]MDD7939628.1 hypothetical protein [Actinomycetospora lutea]